MRGHPVEMRAAIVPVKEWLGSGKAMAQITIPGESPNDRAAADWALEALGLVTERKKDLDIRRGSDQDPIILSVELNEEELQRLREGEGTFHLPWEGDCRGIYIVNPDVQQLEVAESQRVIIGIGLQVAANQKKRLWTTTHQFIEEELKKDKTPRNPVTLQQEPAATAQTIEAWEAYKRYVWQQTGLGTPITLHNVSWFWRVQNGESRTGGDPKNMPIRIDSIKPRGPTPLFNTIETATIKAMQALAVELGVEITTRLVEPVHLSMVERLLGQRVPITDSRKNNRVDFKWAVIRCMAHHCSCEFKPVCSYLCAAICVCSYLCAAICVQLSVCAAIWVCSYLYAAICVCSYLCAAICVQLSMCSYLCAAIRVQLSVCAAICVCSYLWAAICVCSYLCAAICVCYICAAIGVQLSVCAAICVCSYLGVQLSLCYCQCCSILLPVLLYVTASVALCYCQCRSVLLPVLLCGTASAALCYCQRCSMLLPVLLCVTASVALC
jgi:hypothetical protein